MRNWLINTEIKVRENYKGIPMHADTFLHDQLEEVIKKEFPKGCDVLDIGAGAGALSLRMHDLGYNVTALDVDKEKWLANDVEFLNLDINKGISGSVNKKYDAACCVEVIEHIENPWNLFRDIRKILKDGGKLIVSTPNITSFWSRMYFLRSGFFQGFMPYDLEYGHISPLSAYEVELIAKNTGFKHVETRPGGYLPVFDFSEPSKLPLLISNLFRPMFYAVTKGHKKGWVLMFVFEKLPGEIEENPIMYKY